MNRRPFVLALLGLPCLVAAAGACSDAPVDDGRNGPLATSSESSDRAIRDEVTRAAVFAHRCRGTEGSALETCARDVAEAKRGDAAWSAWEEQIATWSRALDHTTICSALDAHRGKTHLYWGAGVDLGGVEREIVADVTKGELAVFTYASSGVRHMLGAQVMAYQAVAYATGDRPDVLAAWGQSVAAADDFGSGIGLGAGAKSWKTSDGSTTGAVSSLSREGATLLGTFASVDGTTYGSAPRASDSGTRALSKAMSFVGHSVESSSSGARLKMSATPAARLGVGGSTASAIFFWAGPRNSAAVHVAIVATAFAEVAARHGGNIDAYCAPSSGSLSGLSFGSAGLAPRAGEGAQLPLDDFPEPPKVVTLDPTSTASCLNGGVVCGGDEVCAPNDGALSCCTAESPVGHLCAKHEDCEESGALCMQVQNESADGKLFSCETPNRAKCSAVANVVPASHAVDTTLCGGSTDIKQWGYGDGFTREEAKSEASSRARYRAQEACQNSTWLCTARYGAQRVGNFRCQEDHPGFWMCWADGTVECIYSLY